MKIVMIGADRSVKGGVSAVVNHLYEAGLDQKADLTYIGTMVDGSKVKKACRAVLALVKFLFALPKADLVHVNMAADASCHRKMIFMKLARIFRKKIIIHEHGGDFQGFYYERCSKKQQEKVKRALNSAEGMLVLSDEWKAFFSEIVNPEKIHVLQNAVPVPDTEKQDYSSHDVLFLGRLCKEKGIGELLDAVPVIKEQIPDFRLILGGFWEDGNENLQRKAEALSDTVCCPGWVGKEERDRLFEACSIFVLPTWFEGQPVSLLEAMAAGMCVAASKVGGIPQILGVKPEPGIMMEAKNPQEIADTLIRLLQDEELRKELGSRARQRILENYDITVYMDRLMQHYESLM